MTTDSQRITLAERTPRTRLAKLERREQLLDAAERILVSQGTTGLTMERLAEWAGVSKALPYTHFDNSDAVLVATYERAVGQLGRRIISAVDAVDPDAERHEKLRVLVAAYLDAVRDIGPVLGVVTAAGSRAAELADPDQRLGVRFLANLLADHFDTNRRRARLAAPILLPVATGAISAWLDGDGTRTEIEDLVVDLFATAIDDTP